MRFEIVPDPVIVAAGDIACDPGDRFFNGSFGTASDCHMRQTSDIALAARPAKVLALGDTQYEDGALWKFQASYEPTWGRLKAITRPAVGNHEYRVPGAAGYFDYFNGPGRFGGAAGDRDKGYYSFDVGTWHLIALNGNCPLPQVACSAASPQARWLRRDLRRNRARCVLAYAGQPRFSSDRTGNYRPLGDLAQLLHERRVDLLLGGDAHNYERFAPQTPDGRRAAGGIRQFVVGTGGKNVSAFPPAVLPTSEVRLESFGVLALTLHPTSYEWRFLAEPGGVVLDSGGDGCR